ncbi:MAG: hypothetical protein EAZ20_14540, partial [Bacteroidetes bacterium]
MSTTVNLGAGGNYENQVFNFSNPDAGLTPVINCPSAALPDNTDGWITLQAASNGNLLVQYTPSVDKDIAISVYSGACGLLTSVQCVNSFGSGVTESLSFNVVAGSQYRIRVVNVTDNTAITGRISAYMGPRAVGDLCTDAQEVGIGTCDYPFNVMGNFIQNEAADVSCSATRLADGWLKIRVGGNKRVRVSYGSATKDAMLNIYGATATTGFSTFTPNNCKSSSLTQVACINNITGSGTEAVEFNANSTIQEYYIRVSNITDGNTMDGNLCVSEVLARDDCASALSDANFIKVGDCNLKFDVLRTHTASGLIDPSCVTGGSLRQDAWMVLDYRTALVTTTLTLEYAASELPNLVIYRKSGAQTCANITGSDDIACSSAGSINFLSVNFIVTPGNYYFIRVIRNANSGTSDMTGLMCLYDNSKKAEDNFFSAPTFNSSGIDCGKIFNLQQGFNNAGSILASDPNPYVINCPSTIDTKNDAWGRFEIGTLGAVSSIFVEYNNDNRDPSIANDVALSVYRLPLITAPAPAGVCGSAATVVLNSTVDNLTIATTNYGGSDISGTFCDGGLADAAFGDDDWYTITTASKFVTTFDTYTSDATLYVYSGSCGSLFLVDCNDGAIGAGISSVSINPSGSTTYFIRIVNKSNSTALTGKFSIFEREPAALVSLNCANNVVEGTEQIVLTGASLIANSIYFVRVANVSTSDLTTQGTLCIRNDQVPVGDLCVNAFTQLVGDCDLSFDVPLTYVNTPPIGIPNCANAPSVAIPTIFRDAWATFTATNTQTTIEYLSSKNSAIALYRGSCTGLILVSCTNELPATPNGIERLKGNTIIGLQYFVRIMDIDNNGSGMLGQ